VHVVERQAAEEGKGATHSMQQSTTEDQLSTRQQKEREREKADSKERRKAVREGEVHRTTADATDEARRQQAVIEAEPKAVAAVTSI